MTPAHHKSEGLQISWYIEKLWTVMCVLTWRQYCFSCGSCQFRCWCHCLRNLRTGCMIFNRFPSVHCCLVVTWRERADLLALVCDVYCDFVTFPFGILGQVWYSIVLIPDPCCLPYFAWILDMVKNRLYLVTFTLSGPQLKLCAWKLIFLFLN